MFRDNIKQEILGTLAIENPIERFDRIFLEIEMSDMSDTQLIKLLLTKKRLLSWPKILVKEAGLYEDYKVLRKEDTRVNRNSRPEDRVEVPFKLKEISIEIPCCIKPQVRTIYLDGLAKPETLCMRCSAIIQNPKAQFAYIPHEDVTARPIPQSSVFSRWKDFSLWILRWQGRSMLKATESDLTIIHQELEGEVFSYDKILKICKSKKLKHLYQNVYSVMERLKPGCRQMLTPEQIREIKDMFHSMGFEGDDQKGKLKNSEIWLQIKAELTFDTIH